MVDFDTDDDISRTQMPTGVQDPYIKDNTHANSVSNAHPISQSNINKSFEDGSLTIEFDLAAIQAVADGTRILEESDSVRMIAENDSHRYYQVDSDIFYRLAAAVKDEYETYIQVEDLIHLIEAHTRQFLEDIHTFDGEFEHTATLCDAYNNPTVQEGSVCHETEPEDAHYGFVDARGLVVEVGTHS